MIWIAAALLLAWLIYRTRANLRIRRPPVVDEGGRPYERHDVTLSDGETVPLIDSGSGPAILLIPGADGIRETWRYQVPVLARRHRVLAPDLRCSVPAGATFERLWRDALEVLDARGVANAVVIGQSLGGAIALALAAARPERVRGLVIANSLARVGYQHVGLNRTLLVPVAMATTRYLPTVLARWCARAWCRLEVWIYDSSPGWRQLIDYALWTGPRTVSPRVSSARVALLKREDLRPSLGGIVAPTVVVKGPRDSYVPVAWSREIAGLVPGATYREIAGTGHCSHVSMPETFNAVVLAWLDDTGDVGGSKEGET